MDRQIEVRHDLTACSEGQPCWSVWLCCDDGDQVQMLTKFRTHEAAEREALKAAGIMGLSAFLRESDGTVVSLPEVA